MTNDNSVMLLLLFFIVIIYIFYQIRFVDKKPQTVYINRSQPQPIYIRPSYRPHRYRPPYRPHRHHHKKIIKVDPIMPLVRPDIKK
jgi:hypothetical protein